jgi:hypothetical protein
MTAYCAPQHIPYCVGSRPTFSPHPRAFLLVNDAVQNFTACVAESGWLLIPVSSRARPLLDIDYNLLPIHLWLRCEVRTHLVAAEHASCVHYCPAQSVIALRTIFLALGIKGTRRHASSSSSSSSPSSSSRSVFNVCAAAVLRCSSSASFSPAANPLLLLQLHRRRQTPLMFSCLCLLLLEVPSPLAFTHCSSYSVR